MLIRSILEKKKTLPLGIKFLTQYAINSIQGSTADKADMLLFFPQTSMLFSFYTLPNHDLIKYIDRKMTKSVKQTFVFFVPFYYFEKYLVSGTFAFS